MKQHIIRCLQITIGISLLIISILHWKWDAMGTNLINFTCASIFFIGLDHILLCYRLYLNDGSCSIAATFVVFCMLELGIIFQKFNQTNNNTDIFNVICYVIIMIVLLANALAIVIVLLMLFGYMIRQIYRLITQTQLSSQTVIQRYQLDIIMSTAQPFNELKIIDPTINATCSICLRDFGEDTIAVALPGCGHCFHDSCIEQWLVNKPVCPNCRNNVQIGFM